MTTSFDRQIARLLLEICRYTYAKSFQQIDTTEIDDALDWINRHYPDYLAESLEPLRGGDTSVACVFCFPDKNIVAYMGTKTEFNNAKNIKESIDDWLKNFRVAPVPFRLNKEQLGSDEDTVLEGRVHAGFLSELRAVQAKVINTLLTHGGKEKPLYVTGHSQEGGEAILATGAFLAGGFKVESSYCFASPRSGDAEFTKNIPAGFPLHRIEFGNDIVPHVPPTLISQWIKYSFKLLQKLPVSELAKKFMAFTCEDLGYVGAGNLCYGNNKTGELQVDMSAKQEADIFLGRLLQLMTHQKDWVEHHHLAGTTEQVKAGKKGNYTALVSDFPIKSSV